TSDTLTTRDFYSLFSFFPHIDEAAQNPYTGFVDYTPVPTLLLSDTASDEKLAKLGQQIVAKEKQFAALPEAARGAFADWLKSKPDEPSVPGLVAAFSFDEIETNKVANSVDSSKPASAHEGPTLVEGKYG